MGSDLKFLKHFDVKVEDEITETASVKLPKSVVKNGTMYLAVFAVPKASTVAADKSKDEWWREAISGPRTSYSLTRLTEYSIPEAETFNLLGGETAEAASTEKAKKEKSIDRSRNVCFKISLVMEAANHMLDN